MALFSSLYKNKNERMKKIPYRMKNICIKKFYLKKSKRSDFNFFVRHFIDPKNATFSTNMNLY